MATLLSMTRDVCAEIGLTQPTVVASAQDIQTIQIWKLLNLAGRSLQQETDWTALQQLKVVNIGEPVVTTGDLTTGSAVITNMATTVGISANTFVVSGDAIPVAARVVSVDSATQVTMDMESTGDSTATTLTFAKDTYDFPDDFDHFINQTSWDRTNRWPLLGPDSPQIDEWHRSGIVVTGPRRHFRQIGPLNTAYRLWPPPSTTDTPFTVVFEYVSRNWATTALGVPIPEMTADTDIPLLNARAIIESTKWRFLQAKRLDYAAIQAEANDYIRGLVAQDGGARTLSMAMRPSPLLITPGNVPDGYFPSS